MNKRQSVAFLLGVPRSGSTLLSVLLDQHPDLYCPPEPWLLLGLDALGQVPAEHAVDPILINCATTQFFGPQRHNLLKRAACEIYKRRLTTSGKRLFVDKTPRYYHCLELLKRFLPENRAILLLRNPLDVAASYQTSWNVNLPEIISTKSDSPFLFDYILGFTRLCQFETENPVLRVQYENLVTNPQAEMRRVFDFLELPQATITDHISPMVSDRDAYSFGDRKILETSHVHSQSIGTYKGVFSNEEVSILINALGENTFRRLGYATQYFDACAEFEVTPEPETHKELLDLAEGYVTLRDHHCQNPKSLLGRIRDLSHELDASRQRTVHFQQQAANLQEQAENLQRQTVALERQIHELQYMGLKGRIKSDLRYIETRIKHTIYRRLWHIASGHESPPLPRITIVTPVLNAADYIESAVRSVLTQNYPDLEYIIVDGGSTDETLKIIEGIQNEITGPNKISLVISEPDNGMYDAVAKGFSESSGEILGYLNADDLLEGGALASVGRYFASHPKVAVIYHEDAVLVSGWKYPNVEQPERIGTSDLLQGHILFQDGVFFRRDAYEVVGGLRRDLKLAGDYDLWLRLSARFRFVRKREHVSCFRVRSGQLSQDMAAYHREGDIARKHFLKSASALDRLRWTAQGAYKTIFRKLIAATATNRNRLFFPIDFSNMPPPSVITPGSEYGNALSPIDSMPAERLLFSATDSRFGEKEIHYIYLDSRHNIAIMYPPVDEAKLEDLYRKFYSSPPTEIQIPDGPSPYRGYDRQAFWEKMLLRLPVEKLGRFVPTLWSDTTLDELETMLRASGINTSRQIRFLDIGCFEGDLLERIQMEKPWLGYGLEPNEKAAAKAREKDLNVWCGKAENACQIVPDSLQFDVIFMGQSIEHVDDPVLVLRGLRQLLAPAGVIVISTPNLDSREIDWFGPTWAHWHPPFHRYIFSRKGLYAVARQTGLQPTCFKTFSHCYWTTMSIARNKIGLGGSVSHAVTFDSALCLRAQRINFWQQILWNRLGKGDYCFLVMKDGAHG